MGPRDTSAAVPADRARSASSRLARGVGQLLGDDLIAIWLYGGQLAPGGSPGDVDLHVIVNRDLSGDELESIRRLHAAICADLAIDELDAWYVLLEEARSTERPHDLNWPVEVHDENWAIKRAHWHAGAYVLVHGVAPEAIVIRPDWDEIEAELIAQLDHAVARDDHDDPAGLTLRLCRVLLSLARHDLVHFKLDAARWALDTVSPSFHPHIAAAMRVYRGAPEPGDRALVGERTPAFCREARAMADRLLGLGRDPTDGD